MTKKTNLKVFIATKPEDRAKLIKLSKALHIERYPPVTVNEPLMLISTEKGATLIDTFDELKHLTKDYQYVISNITIEDINQMLLDVTFDNSKLY